MPGLGDNRLKNHQLFRSPAVGYDVVPAGPARVKLRTRPAATGKLPWSRLTAQELPILSCLQAGRDDLAAVISKQHRIVALLINKGQIGVRDKNPRQAPHLIILAAGHLVQYIVGERHDLALQAVRFVSVYDLLHKNILQEADQEQQSGQNEQGTG